MRNGFLVAALTAFCAVSMGAAADPATDTAIAACAAKTDAAVRLACYDAIAAQLKSPAPVAAAPQAAPVPVSAAQPKAPPAAPTVADFGSEFIAQKQKEDIEADTPEGPSEFTAKVAAIEFSGIGRFTVTLDNGQVWRQVQGEGEPKRLAKRVGTTVTVSRGFWKSYNLEFEAGGNTYKVVRDK